MRLIANLKHNNSNIKRLMIYDSNEGVFLFGYDKKNDSNAIWDSWFENIEDAIKEASQTYGIDKNDWLKIPDPLKNCQHDWIEPVRVKGREIGKPVWGKFEKLIKGKWIEIES